MAAIIIYQLEGWRQRVICLDIRDEVWLGVENKTSRRISTLQT